MDWKGFPKAKIQDPIRTHWICNFSIQSELMIQTNPDFSISLDLPGYQINPDPWPPLMSTTYTTEACFHCEIEYLWTNFHLEESVEKNYTTKSYFHLCINTQLHSGNKFLLCIRWYTMKNYLRCEEHFCQHKKNCQLLTGLNSKRCQ